MSNGVLHHLERPEEGLRSLAGVIDSRGAMVLMLDGNAPRVEFVSVETMSFGEWALQRTKQA